MAKIEKIVGREIIDSRGFPTVEAQVYLDDQSSATSSVPSGASTGKFEAHELRDGDNRKFLGKGVLNAVKNINTIISEHLKGQDPSAQENIDKLLIKLYSSSLFKFSGFLTSKLFFSENFCTGETLIFCPLLDFLGGWV